MAVKEKQRIVNEKLNPAVKGSGQHTTSNNGALNSTKDKISTQVTAGSKNATSLNETKTNLQNSANVSLARQPTQGKSVAEHNTSGNFLTSESAFPWVVTKMDTPKSDYRERTGTEWLVFRIRFRFSVNPNSNPDPNPNPKTNHSVPVLSR